MNRGPNTYMGNGYPPNAFVHQQPMQQMPHTPNYMYQMPPYPPQQQPRGISQNRLIQQQPGPPMFQGQANQFAPPPPQEKKGLLSKLFRNSNNRQSQPPPTAQSLFSLPANSSRSASAATTATTAASGGVLQSLMNPANITSMLNNTQRVLQAAESFGPLVQQYGPLVKNIPSIWKLYTGMKNTDQAESTEEPQEAAAHNIEKLTPPHKQPKKTTAVNDHSPTQIRPHIKQKHHETPKPVQQFAKGESLPKLFF